jgi:hypothetical protein
MSIRIEPLSALAQPRHRAFSLSLWLDREGVFGWLMMALPLLFLAAFVGYPFFLRHSMEPTGPSGSEAGSFHRSR